jgi:hypothetical protein
MLRGAQKPDTLHDAAHVCDSKTRDGTTSACYLNDKTRTPTERDTDTQTHTQSERVP